MDQLDLVTVNELELFMEINHDNIVRYFDHFHFDKQTFLIMEYCEVSIYLTATKNHIDKNIKI